jgi:raffinose/stachyose/melibiose transport system substrate-binding protein
MTRRNPMSRRTFLHTLGGMSGAGLLLAACGGTQSAGGGTAAPAATSAPAAAGSAPTGQTLTIWHLATNPKPFMDVFQRWADKTGNKLNLIAIPGDAFENQTQTRWAAGERPDLMEYHGGESAIITFNPEANLQDLSGEAFMAKAPNLYPALGTYKGKTYAAITSFPQVFGLYYNKKALADVGITAAPKNFDEVQAACAALKQQTPDVVPIWESGGSGFPPQILPTCHQADRPDSWDQDVVDKKTTIDAPDSPWLASLVMYDTFLKNGYFNKDITTAKFEDGIKAVAEGKAAMIALPPFVDRFNEAFSGDTAKTDSTIGFAYPASKQARAWWIASPTGTYFAPKTGDAAREAAALDFIRYATGEGYQQTVDESQTFPVLEGFKNPSKAQGLTLELKKAFDDNSRAPGNWPPGVQFDRLMNTLLSGQATPQEVVKQAQLQFAQGAKAQKLPGW